MTNRTREAAPPPLIRLVDAGLTVAHPAQDVRERRVVTTIGEELGRVDALLFDPLRRRVRYLRVAAGGVLGLGARRVLIPCTAVVRVDGDAVVIDRRRGRRPGHTGYDPALAVERCWLDDHFLACAPFWSRLVLDPVLGLPHPLPHPQGPRPRVGDAGMETRGWRRGRAAGACRSASPWP
jgi:sporulation protein YlmC with PRC-barrel domain